MHVVVATAPLSIEIHFCSGLGTNHSTVDDFLGALTEKRSLLDTTLIPTTRSYYKEIANVPGNRQKRRIG